MNSRERVLAALNHIQPDMVPLDLGGNQSGIHIVAYKRLLDHLGIEDKNICYADFVQQAAKPSEELLERFDIDVRWIHPESSILPEDFVPEVEGEYQGIWDQFGVFWGNSADKKLEDVLYYDPVINPLSEMKTVQEIREYDWPDGTDTTPFKGLREQVKKLRETSDYAIAAPPVGCIYEYTTFLFGFTKALIHMRRNPELIVATMEELEKYWTDYATTFLNEVKFDKEHYVDIVANNGDLAQQTGPIMNPKTVYEPLIKPIEKRFSMKLHSLADVKINYHCCGSVPQFIPHFAEIGYDAVNPIQVGASDMEPCSLKKRFGDMITFWGGLCDTQSTLPFGSPEAVREEVERNMACLKLGGGFIASNIHNITSEVPPENIVAMFDAAREFRHY
ncbi:MAG: uroporphyrinogen decarboxylase family protein [Candidatus Thorarchaeota archaeon]